MRIGSFKVRGFRTIREELDLPLQDRLTIVGPNNCGKTNSLKALNQFFTGYENNLEYEFETDICHGEKSIQTAIQMVIRDITEADDKEIFQNLRKVRELLEIQPEAASEVTLYLTFSKNSNPTYRVFPNTKRPRGSDAAAYSRAEKALFQSIFSKISVHYIPSEKSIPQLYESLVEPFLKETIHEALLPHISSGESRLQEISEEVTATLNKVGLGGIDVSFGVPTSAHSFIGSVLFSVKDPNSTPVFSKGMGIQSVTLLSALCWICEREVSKGRHVLWLIEEPESYLHPELLRQSDEIIKNLTQISQVVITTHSLGFVPSDPSKVLGLELSDGWTKGKKFQTYGEATSHIRNSLGIKFSDFYNLSHYNVFVEGKTDRGYLNHVIGILRESHSKDPDLSIVLDANMSIHDFDGVKGLEGFLRATYQFIASEVKSVTIFDGDDAGDKSRRALVNFFGQKSLPFESNRNYVVVRDRFSIESLIEEKWLIEMHSEHPNWFDDFSFDAHGNLLPFTIKDTRKTNVLHWFTEKATTDDLSRWSPPWIALLKTLNSALKKQC